MRSRGFNLSSTLGHERHETRERLHGVGEAPELLPGLLLAFSLPSSKSTFSQPFKDKHLSDAVRIDRMIIFHLRIRDENRVLSSVIFLVRLQDKFKIDHS